MIVISGDPVRGCGIRDELVLMDRHECDEYFPKIVVYGSHTKRILGRWLRVGGLPKLMIAQKTLIIVNIPSGPYPWWQREIDQDESGKRSEIPTHKTS